MRKGVVAILVVIGLTGLIVGLLYLRIYLGAITEAPRNVDLIRVDKSDRRLELLRDGEVLKTYHVSLGANPVGHKQREGDERTPEGRYRIDWRKPGSQFYRALHISYPNAEDRRAASRLGVSPGGAIMIHGQPNGWGWAAPFLSVVDWTDGCIAVSNREMKEIWNAVPDGTPIEITP